MCFKRSRCVARRGELPAELKYNAAAGARGARGSGGGGGAPRASGAKKTAAAAAFCPASESLAPRVSCTARIGAYFGVCRA